MRSKIKLMLVGLLLAGYVLSAAGCAALWFLAGAGTAATVAAVSNDKK